MLQLIYELRKNCCGTGGRDGTDEGSIRGPRGPKKGLGSPLSACSQRGTGESKSALFSKNGGCIVIKLVDDRKSPRKLPELVQMDTKYPPFYYSSLET